LGGGHQNNIGVDFSSFLFRKEKTPRLFSVITIEWEEAEKENFNPGGTPFVKRETGSIDVRGDSTRGLGSTEM